MWTYIHCINTLIIQCIYVRDLVTAYVIDLCPFLSFHNVTRVPAHLLGAQMCVNPGFLPSKLLFISRLCFHGCFLLISVPSAHVSERFFVAVILLFRMSGIENWVHMGFTWGQLRCLPSKLSVLCVCVLNNPFKIVLIIQLHQAKDQQLCSFHLHKPVSLCFTGDHKNLCLTREHTLLCFYMSNKLPLIRYIKTRHGGWECL